MIRKKSSALSLLFIYLLIFITHAFFFSGGYYFTFRLFVFFFLKGVCIKLSQSPNGNFSFVNENLPKKKKREKKKNRGEIKYVLGLMGVQNTLPTRLSFGLKF